ATQRPAGAGERACLSVEPSRPSAASTVPPPPPPSPAGMGRHCRNVDCPWLSESHGQAGGGSPVRRRTAVVPRSGSPARAGSGRLRRHLVAWPRRGVARGAAARGGQPGGQRPPGCAPVPRPPPRCPRSRPAGAHAAASGAVRRPPQLPSARVILAVHLGTVARRLRLAGVDAAYANDLDDDALVEQANHRRRVLLTRDRGLLRRRKLWLGAYVRGARPDEQFRDVLDRFAPALAPWTRCTACNGLLSPARKAD